jgi:hypothetical protein
MIIKNYLIFIKNKLQLVVKHQLYKYNGLGKSKKLVESNYFFE